MKRPEAAPRPVARPATRPATRPAARPVARHVSRPGSRPGFRPGFRPGPRRTPRPRLRRRRHGPSRACRLALTVGTALALAAALMWSLTDPSDTVDNVPRAEAVTTHTPLTRSPATRLTIPALGVDAPVTGLALDRHDRLASPPTTDPNLVGWYENGPSPGEQGTAVAVGHRDTSRATAVFVGLGKLRRGDVINVARQDRLTAVFTVDSVRTVDKARFPDAEVYGPTGRPELRLLTCGGTFDRRAGGYAANTVVFSHLTHVQRT